MWSCIDAAIYLYLLCYRDLILLQLCDCWGTKPKMFTLCTLRYNKRNQGFVIIGRHCHVSNCNSVSHERQNNISLSLESSSYGGASPTQTPMMHSDEQPYGSDCGALRRSSPSWSPLSLCRPPSVLEWPGWAHWRSPRQLWEHTNSMREDTLQLGLFFH